MAENIAEGTQGHEQELVNVEDLKATLQDFKDDICSKNSNYTPTLQNAPKSTDLTYVKDGKTIAFTIGQFCRVADANAPLGYKFYQLYDIRENGTVAVWGQYSTKVPPTYIPPTAKSLTYNGEAQEPLVAGSTEDGIISYSLDGTTWQNEMPTITDAGDYTIFWKLSGDTTHADVSSMPISVTIAKVTPTLTAPTAKELTYNRNDQDLVNAGSTDWGTLKYSLDGTTWSTDIPQGQNADTYIVYYKVEGDENINDIAAETVNVTIARKAVSNPTIRLSQDEYIYDGSDCEPSVTVKDGNRNIDPSEYSVQYVNNRNAGTATVIVADSGLNFAFNSSMNFTINKADGEVTTLPVNRAVTYNGEAQPIADAGSGTGTMYYRLGEVGDFSTLIPTATEAGTYTLYYYAAESDNYNQSETGSISVTIVKANAVYSAPTAKSLDYTGEAQALLNAGSTSHGTIQYSMDGEAWGTTIPTQVGAGDYAPQWRLVGDSNHNDVAAQTINVTINKVAPVYTAPTAKTLTYTAAAQALLNGGQTSEGTIKYSLDNETWSTEIPQQTNADTYFPYWKLEGDANHTDVAAQYIEVVIAKVTPTVVAPVAIQTLVYNTEAQTLANVGSTNYGTMQYSVDGVNYGMTMPTGTDAGSYTLYYKVVGDSNINDVAPQTIACGIAKANPTYTAPTAKSGLVYTAEAQELINDGVTSHGSFLYSLDEDTWGSEIPQSTNATTEILVYWKLVGDSNHNDVASTAVACAIDKAQAAYTAPVAKALSYTGEAQELLIEGSTEDGTIQYSADGTEWSTDIPSGTNAGDYAPQWKLVGDSNHYGVEETTINVNIAKVAADYEAPVAKSGLEYTASAQDLVTAGSTEEGVMYYSLNNENWGTSVPQGTNVNTYTVYWKIIGDSNHLDKAVESMDISIAKVDAAYTAPTAKSGLIYDGTAQALLNNGSTEDGTIQYSSDNENWGTTIPSYTNATESVTVYWRIVGDTNHFDKAAASIDCSIAKADLEASVSLADWVYDTTANTPLISGNSGDGEVTYTYKVKGAADSTYTETKPTLVNDYVVRAQIAETANYNGATVTSEFAITKAVPSYTAPTIITGIVYDTEAHDLLNAGSTDEGTIEYSTDNETWGTEIPQATNAGSHTTYWRLVGDANHSDIASTSLTTSIAKANITPYVSMSGWTYGGTAANPSVSGNLGDGEVTYTYKAETAVDSEYTTAKPTNAGTYVVRAQVAETANYNGGTATSTFTIAKANPSFDAPTAKTLVYNGGSQQLVNAGSTSDGTMQYSLDGTTWGTSIPSGQNVGSYTVYYRVIGDANHNNDNGDSVSVSIAKVTPSVTAPTAKVLTYNTSAQNLVNAGSTNFGTLQYSLDNSTWSTDIPQGTNYGSYTVYYRVVGDSNINDVASASVACSISEKDVSAPTIELTPSSFTYSGNACTPSVVVKDGTTVIDPSEYSVEYSNNTAAGTATVTIIDNTAGNYNVYGTKTFNIAKAAPSYTAPTAKTGLVYNGSGQTLLNAGSTSHGTIQYSLNGSDWSTSVPSGSEVPGYTVYWRLVGDANHSDVGSTAISVGIAKVTPSVSAPTAKSLTYNGEAQTLANAGSTNWGTLQYSLDNSTWSTSVPTGTNATSYSVYYRVVGNSNINDVASASISCSIGKANPSYTAPSAKSGLVYNGSAQSLLNGGSTSHGTIQYSTDNSTWSTSIPTGTNASTGYTSYWRLVGDSNHNSVGSSSLSTAIARANISASVSLSGWTYGASANNPSVSGNSGGGSVSYAYKVYGAADSTYTGTKPSNAGTYVVRAIIDTTTNYNGATVTNTFTIAKASGSVSISGVSLSYNGNSRNLVSVSGNTGTMHYSTDYSNWSTSIPTATNASSWTIYWYMDASSNYERIGASSSRYVSSSIAKIDPSITAYPTNANPTYNGSAQNLLTGGSANVSGSFSYSQATNAGSYTGTWWFTPSDTTNYNSLSGTVSASIAKAGGSAYATANGWTYDGNSRAVIYNAGGYGTLQYQLDGGSWQTTIPTAVNAGSYNCRVYSPGDSNHNEAYSGWYTCSVAKASGSVSISGRSLSYNGGSQALASVSGNTGTMHYSTDYSNWSTSIPSSTNCGSWTIYWYMDASANYEGIGASTSRYVSTSMSKINPTITAYPTNANPTYNGGNQYLLTGGTANVSGSFSYSTGSAAGSYTATWWFTPSDTTNYNSLSGTVAASIAKASGSAYATGNSWTYDGSSHYVIYGAGGIGSLQYQLEGGSWSTSIPTAVNAGTYRCRVYASGDANHNEATSGWYTCTVSKASGSVSISGRSLSYSGGSQSLASVSGATGTMHYSTDYSNWSTSIPAATNAGSYTIYWYMDESSNYNGIGASTGRYVSTSIAKINPSITANPTNANPTYTGGNLTLLTGGSANVSGSFSYSTGVNAGSYTATWWFTPSDTTNYNSLSGNVSASIAKASGSAYATANGWTYNGNAYDVIYNVGGIGSFQYRLEGGSWGTSIPQATNAGTYKCQVYASGDANHNDAYSGWYTCTVAKASQSAPTAYGASVAYGNTATATTSGGGGVGSIEWSNGNTLSGNVGSKTTKARWSGNSNYNASAWSNEVTLSIYKIDPSITAPNAKSGLVYNGSSQTLYNGGSNSTAGSFSYSDGTRTNAGSQTVSWSFTPSDTTNYNSKSGSFTGSIAKATGSISFTSAPSKVEEGASITVAASRYGDGAISFSSSNTSLATVSGSTVTGVANADGTVTITASVAEGTNYTSASTSYTLTVFCNFVDLGLPSGTKWAKGDICKDSSGNYYMGEYTETGCKFSFGNIDGHNDSEDYSWDYATWYNSPGAQVVGDIASNDAEHDAALARLGSGKRLPTFNEMQELVSNCTSSFSNDRRYITLTSNISGYTNKSIIFNFEYNNGWRSSTYFGRSPVLMAYSNGLRVNDSAENHMGYNVRAVK